MTFSLLVLAFGFGSPLMLWGLAAGAIPIVIHLFYRRRFQTVQWAAMRFLIAATKKQSRRLKLEQLLLLAVRTLALVLLALAVARPITDAMGSLQSEGPRHRIIVIDATLSMGYAPNGQSRFEHAKEIAKQVVGRSRLGDAINLVRISDSIPRIIIKRPAYHSAAVIDEIDQLTLFDERIDASIVLKEIDELLAGAPEISRKEIVMITDLQSATWAPQDSNEVVRVRQEMKRLADRARLTIVDVGEPSAPNVAVTGLRTSEQFVLSGRPIQIAATMKNFHSLGATGQHVEMSIDGRLTDTKRIDIPAGQEVAVEFSPSFGGGEHRVEVRIAADGLPVDDVRRLAIPVRDELQVLLVNGKPSGEPMGNSTDYLKLALAPELPNRAAASPIRPTVIRESELLGMDLSRFDCIFICNVALFTEREAEVLRGYLDAGGGVIFCLGDQVQPDNYNQVLHGPKRPLLPGKLGLRIGDAKKKENAYEFDAQDFEHPIVRPFQGNTGTGLEMTKTFAYFQIQPDPDRAANVALRFNSGDPAIVEAAFGQGRVILIATSVDREWSTWAVWGHSLIPLMHEAVNFSIAGRWKDRDVLVGQQLQTHLGLRAAEAVHQLPNGETRSIQVAADGQSLMTEPIATSGFHKINLGTPVNRTEWFAVNVDTVESDLTSLRLEDLRTDLLPGIDFRYMTEWDESTIADGGQAAQLVTESRFARTLLIAVLTLLLVEQLMAWNFLAGTGLLLAAISASFIVNLWAVNRLAGISITASLALFVVVAAIRFRSNWQADQKGVHWWPRAR